MSSNGLTKRVPVIGSLLLYLAALLCLLFAGGNVFLRSWDWLDVLFPLLFGGGLVLARRWLTPERQVRLAVVLLSSGLTVFSFNLGLLIHQRLAVPSKQELRREWARRMGTTWDGRTRLEVLLDLRRAHLEAYPSFPMWAFYGATSDGGPLPSLDVEGEPTLPLSGIPLVTTVGYNESGQYFIYESDQYGFNNPPGVWELGETDILVVGDSFTIGEAVPPDQNFVAHMRRRFPATVNVGYPDNGPLRELASVCEYGAALRPKLIVWGFYEDNDFSDLEKERASAQLVRYLREGKATQRLIERATEIGAAQKRYIDGKLRSIVIERKASPAPTIADVILLLPLRGRLWRVRELLADSHPAPKADFELFEQVLSKTVSTAATWSGKMLLVYLPNPYRCVKDRENPVHVPTRDRIADIALRLNIPFLDTSAMLLAAYQRNPDIFYPYPAHLTPKSYEIVGDAILKTIEERDLLPRWTRLSGNGTGS